jgi:hypothetical protein
MCLSSLKTAMCYERKIEDNVKNTIINTLRILAVPTMFVSIVCFFDLILPSNESDTAIITQRTPEPTGRLYRVRCSVHAEGRLTYREQVPKSFFSAIRTGDKLHIHLTRLLGEWKMVELVRNNRVVATSYGRDLHGILFFGVVFAIVPGLLFFMNFTSCNSMELISNPNTFGNSIASSFLLAIVAIAELVALLFIADYLL